MKVINNCVLVDVNLTDDIFKQITSLLTDQDDINLKILKTSITVTSWTYFFKNTYVIIIIRNFKDFIDYKKSNNSISKNY